MLELWGCEGEVVVDDLDWGNGVFKVGMISPRLPGDVGKMRHTMIT